jgi:hypothetical protein
MPPIIAVKIEAKETPAILWCVERQPDSSFVRWAEGHQQHRIPVRDLSILKELWVLDDQEYEDVCRQLEKSNRVRIMVPTFKFAHD